MKIDLKESLKFGKTIVTALRSCSTRIEDEPQSEMHSKTFTTFVRAGSVMRHFQKPD